MNIIKEHIILLMGVGFFVVGLFDFRHSTYSGGYYYDELALFLLFVGSISITIGILKIREKNNK